jgi:hypothetical protein
MTTITRRPGRAWYWVRTATAGSAFTLLA